MSNFQPEPGSAYGPPPPPQQVPQYGPPADGPPHWGRDPNASAGMSPPEWPPLPPHSLPPYLLEQQTSRKPMIVALIILAIVLIAAGSGLAFWLLRSGKEQRLQDAEAGVSYVFPPAAVGTATAGPPERPR